MGVQDSSEDFRIYFLVGAPRDERLLDTYHNALKLLGKAPGQVEIVPEENADRFAHRIARLVTEHEADGS